MPLNPTQEEALPVLDWFLSENEDDRQTGRSWILAVALIRLAARNPGRFVQARDHIATRDAARYTLVLVEGLINMDQHLRQFREIREFGFQLNLLEPILNWLPPGGRPPPPREVKARRPQVLSAGSASRYERLLNSEDLLGVPSD